MIKPIDNPAAGEEPDFEEDFSDVFDPESFEPEVPAPESEDEDEAAVEFRIEDFEVEEYLPESEETRPDLRPECDEFFAPGGPLRRAAEFGGRPYEFRPQQLEMAGAIADALRSGENLCIEAPTGVGKSFAYLVPLIYRSRLSSRPAVISTETINLQEQLIEKDIPLLRKLTGIDFKAAIAKGRRNYLCRRRFALMSGEQRDQLLPAPGLAMDMNRLGKWMERTADGNRDSVEFQLDPATWPLVCCEGGNCLGPKCAFFRNCFYYKARLEWESADIVIANHALFFTDLAMRAAGCGLGGSLLPNYGTVLIDEAHTLENNAAEHLGLYLSRAGIVSTLNRLFNQESARGLLMRKGENLLEMRAAVVAARDEAYGFFAAYENFLHEWQENARTVNGSEHFPDLLTDKLVKLHKLVSEFADSVDDASFRTELEAQLIRCREFVDGIAQFTGRTLPEAVYYAEAEHNSVALRAAPLNVAELLGELLFNQDFTVMLCSATLTVRNSFEYFVGRTGFCNGGTLKLDSPFGRDQAKIFVSRRMPDPKSEDYAETLIEEIPRFLEMTEGKAFVLFTSYQSMRRTADALRGYFLEKGWQLLIQGESLNRSALLREFREDLHSVLFGTDSFWTGVDVPGESLSNVIVTKLPFAVPSHPLIAARMERIEAAGRSSFSEYSLPEAVLKFRQGAGRLIRSREDRGIIVLLDRRVISKYYGKIFLNSLPYRFEIV